MSLRDKVNELPEKPGVYCFFDVNEDPAYVGKTGSSIRSRLKQHLVRQDSSVTSYGKLDLWDVFYVVYWETEKYDQVENQLIAHFEPYLNLENPEIQKVSVDIENPSRRLNVISEKEADFRKKPYNRIKQKLDHLERMTDKIKMADHTKSTQKLLYKHLEVLESNIEDFLDLEKKVY